MKLINANEARRLSKINSGIIDTNVIQSAISGRN